MDKYAYTPDRFARCAAKYIRWRALSIREPRDQIAAALAAYWWRQAQQAWRI